METLDLFKDFTPEMIDMVRHTGRGCRQKEYMASLSSKEKEAYLRLSFHSREAKERNTRVHGTEDFRIGQSEDAQRVWNNKTQEEIEEFGRRVSEGHAKRTQEEKEETSRRISKANKRWWINLSEGERNRSLGNSFLSSESLKKSREGIRKYIASLTPEEKKRRYRNSVGSDEARRKSIEGIRKHWADITPEEKERWSRRNIEASHKKPTMPELFLGIYLEDRYPREWAYNGDGGRGIVIGGRVPDFVNINGRKQVIEELGVYWHLLEDEVERIEHYKKYGYECIVVWEWDCYLWDELDKIFFSRGTPTNKSGMRWIL